MATYDEIEEALECRECCDVVETHLRYCEHDECGVFETYWRTRHRIEAGDHSDWRSPARMAMTVMMTAESWMHESHDHRVIHSSDPVHLDVVEPDETSLVGVPGDDRMQRLAREAGSPQELEGHRVRLSVEHPPRPVGNCIAAVEQDPCEALDRVMVLSSCPVLGR